MVTSTMTRSQGSKALLRDEEAKAWHDYLEDTRGQHDLRYEEIEPWAWNRLQRRLSAISARMVAILEDDAA